MKRRFIHDLQLLECSILSVEPAYLATSVEVRAEGEKEMELRVFPNESTEEIQETTKEEIVEENVEETEVVEDTEVTTEEEVDSFGNTLSSISFSPSALTSTEVAK